MKIIKKHIKLIILILVVVSIFIIYKITNNNNINYTSLGDGFAIGKNSYGEINYGYSDYIRDYLEEKKKLNTYIKEFSSPDMSIEKLHSNIITNQNIELGSKELNIKHTLRETSILTMSIGLNDLIYRLSIEDSLTEKKVDRITKQIGTHFDELIKEIRKYYPHKIYIVGYYVVEDSNIYLKRGIKNLNRIYSSNEDTIYIDVEKKLNNNKKLLSNPQSMYPNTKGYKVISDEIISKMTKKLEKF